MVMPINIQVKMLNNHLMNLILKIIILPLLFMLLKHLLLIMK